jgi:hypothetical protein
MNMQKEHFEILLESMDSKINLVLEGYSVLAKDIKDTRVELNEDISLLDHKITALSKLVDSVETNLGARIDSVETNLGARIDALHSELIAHRNDTELHKAPRKREARKAA